MSNIETTKELVQKAYSHAEKQIGQVKARLNRPFTLAEKILFGHLEDPEDQELNPFHLTNVPLEPPR